MKNCVLVLLYMFCASSVFAQTNTPPNGISQSALAELTKPEKQIPFKEVIEATTHFRVLDFDTNNPAHVELRKKIFEAAALAGKRTAASGLIVERANEAGNHIE